MLLGYLRVHELQVKESILKCSLLTSLVKNVHLVFMRLEKGELQF